MIAANEIQTSAVPAFAGHERLRPGALDPHQRGWYGGTLYPAGGSAILLRSR